MLQILLLHLWALQKLFCTVKPGITGILRRSLPVFLINPASQHFRNHRVFFREVIIVFKILIILSQPSVFCTDDHFHFFFFSGKVEIPVSVGEFHRNLTGEFQSEEQVFIIQFCICNIKFAVCQAEVAEHLINFSKPQHVLQVMPQYNICDIFVSFFQKFFVKADTFFSICINSVADSQKFFHAGLFHGRKFQKFLQRFQSDIEIQGFFTFEGRGDLIFFIFIFQIRLVKVISVVRNSIVKTLKKL